ncbi:MAG TPA: beta galactosidase jelly roll domain-containing protein [Terracidiphilus sp.]|jgi:hypothetical protein|nr:beta galactosidase jelly roll domain-containing protein [Terracidiphilus sp.]
MRRCAGLALLLAATFAAPFARPQAGAGVVRYHYGDNPAWADPNFDDSAWPIAPNSSFPAPAYQSDGFFWVRAQVAIPAGASDPVAIESKTIDPFPNVQELWVNGRLVGRNGDFPAHARPLAHPRMLVFDIPPGVVRPSSVAPVVLRAWDAPADNAMSLRLRHPDPVNVEFSIAGAPLLHALSSQTQDRA